MKKIYLCFIILLVFSNSFSQTTDENQCWEFSTDYKNTAPNKFYKLIIKRDSIQINIISDEHYYSYNYKLFKKKSFVLDGDKYAINYVKDKARIEYIEKKKRIFVNEISTLEFRRCP